MERNRVVRRKVILMEPDDTPVNFGGGILLDELIRGPGLPEIINKKASCKQTQRCCRELKLNQNVRAL